MGYFSQGFDSKSSARTSVAHLIKVFNKDFQKKERKEKMIEKNRKKVEAKKNRVLFNMNTGTRTHKSKRDYKRVKKWSVEL